MSSHLFTIKDNPNLFVASDSQEDKILGRPIQNYSTDILLEDNNESDTVSSFLKNDIEYLWEIDNISMYKFVSFIKNNTSMTGPEDIVCLFLLTEVGNCKELKSPKE